MEKYSRQALAEGVKNCEELTITTDCEIYRVLNLHYNRNNQIEVIIRELLFTLFHFLKSLVLQRLMAKKDYTMYCLYYSTYSDSDSFRLLLVDLKMPVSQSR